MGNFLCMQSRRLFVIGIIAILTAVLLIGMSVSVNNVENGHNAGTSALTTESGKAVFVGNYELNVSWKLFPDQSTGLVYYSQSPTITSASKSVSFTTANYTVLSGLKIGTYYILIQNGTTFPSTIFEFTGIVPVSSVLETFHFTYMGNGQFNISWAKFPSQSVVRVYYAFGNVSNLTNTSSFVIGSSLPYLVLTFNSTPTRNVDFLLVNDSLFPEGEVNYTSFVQIYSPVHHGLLIAFDGVGVFLDYLWTAILVVVLILIGIGIHKHDKDKRE